MVLGLAYGYMPFFILPLYASLDRLDQRLIEAARDLGASAEGDVPAGDVAAVDARRSMAATVITALPMFGDYYTNTLMSGSPRTR